MERYYGAVWAFFVEHVKGGKLELSGVNELWPAWEEIRLEDIVELVTAGRGRVRNGGDP